MAINKVALKMALRDTSVYFVLPLILALAIGKGFSEYILWTMDATREWGISSGYAFLLTISPFVLLIIISATVLFYSLNKKIQK